MDNSAKLRLIEGVARAITTTKDITHTSIAHPDIKGKIAYGRWFKNRILKGFDVDITFKDIQLRFIEQNPNTKTTYAQRARNGHTIVWVINRKENKWLGRVEDGVYIHNKRR